MIYKRDAAKLILNAHIDIESKIGNDLEMGCNTDWNWRSAKSESKVGNDLQAGRNKI